MMATQDELSTLIEIRVKLKNNVVNDIHVEASVPKRFDVVCPESYKNLNWILECISSVMEKSLLKDAKWNKKKIAEQDRLEEKEWQEQRKQ